MKLVGATEWFRPRPVRDRRHHDGLIAASIALALLVIAYPPAVDRFKSDIGFIPLSYDPHFISSLAPGPAPGRALLGALGSYIGVRR